MRTRIATVVAIGLAVVLLFAVNMAAGPALSSARLDLTEHRLYTLSDGTRSVIAGIDEPVTLRLYLSERLLNELPAVSAYASRVKQLLAEYERLAEGRIRLAIIDPEPFSEDEDRAVGHGLRGAPIGREGESFYFGIVGASAMDDEEVIPFLSPEREAFLEYDLSRLLVGLTRPERKVVGVITTLALSGAGPGPQPGSPMPQAPPLMIHEQLGELFELRDLGLELREIPQDVELLLLVHPRRLGLDARYAIDQFVLRGGRALVFLDAHAEAQDDRLIPGMVPTPSLRSDLDDLLAAWGMELEPDTIVGDVELATPVRLRLGTRVVSFDYPVWLDLQPRHIHADDVITANLGNVTLASPGSLVPVEGATTTFTPLLWTSERAARFTTADLMSGDPESLVRRYEPAGRRFDLAARVAGPAASAFPEGPPAPVEEPVGDSAGGAASTPAGADDTRAEHHIARSEGDIHVVVFADTDLLQDRMWVTVQDLMGSRIALPTAGNGSMVVNAVDHLVGSGELIAVRSRGNFVRPFERVQALRQEAELRFREQEEILSRRLQEAEERILALEERRQVEDAMILTEAQRHELLEFRQERLRIRNELRDVRRDLRRSIENLETRLKLLNIGLMPLLIGLGGVLTGLWRARRRRLAIRPSGAAAGTER